MIYSNFYRHWKCQILMLPLKRKGSGGSHSSSWILWICETTLSMWNNQSEVLSITVINECRTIISIIRWAIHSLRCQLHPALGSQLFWCIVLRTKTWKHMSKTKNHMGKFHGKLPLQNLGEFLNKHDVIEILKKTFSPFNQGTHILILLDELTICLKRFGIIVEQLC